MQKKKRSYRGHTQALRLTRRGALIYGCISAAVLLLAGCGGGGSVDTGSRGSSLSKATPQGLVATLTQSHDRVSGLRDISYTLSLRNATGEAVAFQADGRLDPDSPGPLAKFEIIDDAGALVYPGRFYRDLSGESVPVNVTLTPQQSISVSFPFQGIETMPNPLFPGPGSYRATATFTVSGTQSVVGPLTVIVQ